MKFRFLTSAFMLLALFSYGQKSGASARIAALTSFEEYVLNPQMKDKLEYAMKNIQIACEDEKTSDDPDNWRRKGQIFNAVALDEQLSSKNKSAAYDAFLAYEKALSMEESKAEAKAKTKDKIAGKQDFIDGFTQNSRALYNQGSTAQAEKNYELSYKMFTAITEIPARTASFDLKKKITFIVETGKTTVDILSNAAFMGGLSAIQLNKPEQAEKLMKPIMEEKKIKEDDIKYCYRVLGASYLENKQNDKAKAILAEGRKLFPTDFDLLITEINIALQEGRLAELEEELNIAVKADPNNAMLHFVMGNMYDELFRNKVNYEKWPVVDEDFKSGKSFFDKAVEWYKSALKIDAKNFNAAYSLGAIHVNLSNYYTTAIRNSDSKMSKETRKSLEADYNKYVELGLGFLLEAEKIDANDIGLVRGLKEVYTRKSDEENYKKYSAKEKELLKKGQ